MSLHRTTFNMHTGKSEFHHTDSIASMRGMRFAHAIDFLKQELEVAEHVLKSWKDDGWKKGEMFEGKDLIGGQQLLIKELKKELNDLKKL